MKKLRFGGIEGGGTTFVLSIAEGDPTNVIMAKSIRTKNPADILEKTVSFFRAHPVDAIGFGSFGPVDLNEDSKTYGFITTSPKVAWRNTDVLSPIKSLGLPVAFDTDVNAAALAELRYGNHGPIKNCVYVTVGTGVGIGIIVNGQPLHGLLHPEGGHIRVPPYPGDSFTGGCEFHKDCVEGMTNSAAMAARTKIERTCLHLVPNDHWAWDVHAHYMAHICVIMTLYLSPEVIVLGGGLHKNRPYVFTKIRNRFKELLAQYVRHSKYEDNISSYIVPSRFNAHDSNTSSGAVGTCELARIAYEKARPQPRL